MSYNNFLITSFGRSGTKFLSNLMNKSKKWVVLHEPIGSLDIKLNSDNHKLSHLTLQRFNRNNYGEVNSRLRHYFDVIKVRKKGVIFRDPKDIIVSVYNRKTDSDTKKILYELNVFWNSFKKKIYEDESIVEIDFKKMTSDEHYLKDILIEFGVEDISHIDLTPQNKTEEFKINSFGELPNDIIKVYNSLSWLQ